MADIAEEWRPVKCHEDRYEVSSLGKIRSLDRPVSYKDGRSGRLKGAPVKGVLGNRGYIIVTLDSTHRKLLHRVVAEAFHPNASEFRCTVNHKDGDKLNNCAENLEWASYKENNDHARETSLNMQHSENCNITRYGAQLIQALRNVHLKYHPTYAELGAMFGMSAYHAGEIVRGESRTKE